MTIIAPWKWAYFGMTYDNRIRAFYRDNHVDIGVLMTLVHLWFFLLVSILLVGSLGGSWGALVMVVVAAAVAVLIGPWSFVQLSRFYVAVLRVSEILSIRMDLLVITDWELLRKGARDHIEWHLLQLFQLSNANGPSFFTLDELRGYLVVKYIHLSRLGILPRLLSEEACWFRTKLQES